jgi:hypothetical protein
MAGRRAGLRSFSGRGCGMIPPPQTRILGRAIESTMLSYRDFWFDFGGLKKGPGTVVGRTEAR